MRTRLKRSKDANPSILLQLPALLPEDTRYLGLATAQIQAAVPGLARWLEQVFRVLGGYVFTTGSLVLYVARMSLHAHTEGVGVALALAGVTSIGAMTATNFVLGSDFRWALLGVALPWGVALVLYASGK